MTPEYSHINTAVQNDERSGAPVSQPAASCPEIKANTLLQTEQILLHAAPDLLRWTAALRLTSSLRIQGRKDETGRFFNVYQVRLPRHAVEEIVTVLNRVQLTHSIRAEHVIKTWQQILARL